MKENVLRRFARRALAVAALAAAPVLAVAGPALAADAPKHHGAAAPMATSATDKTAYENEVARLTSIQRMAHGCGALRVDTRLVASAEAHSTDMVQRHFFDHAGSDGSTFVQREARAGYPNANRAASGENIAWGFRTPQDVVGAWMKSPGHRANILNCSSIAVGVGLAYTSGGNAYWTQDFGRS
jgi:uncharacterized protein YkwD